jgi:hypothetical protein
MFVLNGNTRRGSFIEYKMQCDSNNFQTMYNIIKLITENESVTKKVLFGNDALTALMSRR